jgi:dihydrodipicolinate synthase/N-acetylneuraminate lyase
MGMARGEFYEVACVREALQGPVPSVTPQFFKSGEIDWKATGNVIEAMVAGGAKSLLVTNGDSLLTILTDKETMEFNRFVAEVAGKRAMVIACSKAWCQAQLLDYAATCKEYGCDLVIPFVPDWAQSVDGEELTACFREIGQVMPVMLLTNMCNGRGMAYSTIDALRKEEGIVAIKDDMPGPYGKMLLARTRDRFAFLQGGRAFHFLDQAPFGADGYLSVYARVFPHISHLFWRYYTEGRLQEAVEVVEKYDVAFFDFVAAEGVNFSAAIQGMYEIAGLGRRWRRSPYSSLTEEQMEKLGAFLEERKLVP